ncbi:MAG: hemolysin family protein [Syntrophales bacterium]|nr:hemolysin family protein [Syntrophales bacterium]
MESNLFSLFLIFVCLGLEGLFSGGELSLVASDINRIRQKARAGSRSAMLTLKLLDKPEWFLATTLTGTNICVVASTVIATSMFISTFGAVRGEFISVIIMIPLVLVMGEIIPKSISRQHAEFISLRVSWFIWIASWVLYPVVFIVSRIARGAVYISTGGKESVRSPYITRDGLKFLLRKERAESDIASSEKEMIRRILGFSEVTVGQIMVPLSNTAVLQENSTLGEAAVLTEEKGFSRIPVYRDRIYNITGILHCFDLFKTLHDQAELTENDKITSCLRPTVFYVPETKSAGELLFELQRSGEHMAIVVDEYGGAVGIVTIEDILEEIVGEIEDEYDKEEKLYKKIGPGRYLFDARIKIDYLSEIILLEIPAGDYETLGGFLLNRMGKIPKRSETLRFNNLLFVIEDADMKSIKEVLVILPDLVPGTRQ